MHPSTIDQIAGDIYNAWGIDPTWSLFAWVAAVVPLVAPKFVLDVRRDRNRVAPQS